MMDELPTIRVEVTSYPEEWFHRHRGLCHSHPLRPGEDQEEPAHWHEIERGDAEAVYFAWEYQQTPG